MKSKIQLNRIFVFILVLGLLCSTFGLFASAAQNETTEPPEMIDQEITYFIDANGNLITASGVVNAQLTVDTPFASEDAIPDNAKFTKIDLGNQFNGRDVINFQSIKFGTVWKTAGENVVEHGTPMASGWESVAVKELGGTQIAFMSSQQNRYYTVEDGKLVVGNTAITETPTGNEVFDMETKTVQTVNKRVWIEHKESGKVVTVNGTADDPITVTADKEDGEQDANAYFTVAWGVFENKEVMNFISSTPTVTQWKATEDRVFQITKQNVTGWEAITIVPMGDGTVAFKSNAGGKAYLTVQDGKLVIGGSNVTEAGKFIVHASTEPAAVKNFESVEAASLDGRAIDLQWSSVANSIFTGYELWRATVTDGVPGSYEKIYEGTGTAYSEDPAALEYGTTYSYKVHTVNANSVFAISEIIEVTTKTSDRPATIDNAVLTTVNDGIEVSIEIPANIDKWRLYRAESRFGTYELIGNDITDNTFIDSSDEAKNSKYENYYKIMVINENGASPLSKAFSVETQMFGDNMIFYAPTDDMAAVKSELSSIYTVQGTRTESQFGTGRYALMFKKGDYKDAGTINLGFYTHIGGLGQSPEDVALSNVHIPPYLPGDNATCNFWRSGENFSVTTGHFSWAVAQAAPLRRTLINTNAQFDWNYGWASGGYVADSVFKKDAGSYSQQQFYMRNSEIEGKWYGINFNGVLQGTPYAGLNEGLRTVDYQLKGVDGLDVKSNWHTGGEAMPALTTIDKSPIVKEKPFLYIDEADGEYKVFVPGIRENASGTSWTNDDMGVGESISLDDFYIAKEGVDNAASINTALEEGKHIFLTPGIYYAEEAIRVMNEGTIVLGYGMATIIPQNDEAAMIVGDNNATIAGIIFDAERYSKNMLVVGTEGTEKDSSDNPTLLSDLFFRIGGVYEGVASTEDALVVNSNDVIGDHFWIWRADHGDGVGWDLNIANNGIVVEGDNMTMYGLFVEHFQEFDILWKGENGRVFFVQNEKAYDPQDQAEWMSHYNNKRGYAAYKVVDEVENHYVVGLGMYDVFINTNGADMYLDNAMEVPNKTGVLVESACVCTFSGIDETGNGLHVGIKNIVNGVGKGCGWLEAEDEYKFRSYLISYNNGIAQLTKNLTANGEDPSTYDGRLAKDVADEITTLEIEDNKVVIPQEDKFEIVIKSSSNTDIISLDGTVTPSEVDTDVTLILKVTNLNYLPDVADTIEITVAVPGVSKETFLVGDVNNDGTISLKDVLTLQKHLAYIIELDEIGTLAADANQDGKLAMSDALLIQKYIVKLPSDGSYVGEYLPVPH